MPQVGSGDAQQGLPNAHGYEHNSPSAVDDDAPSKLHFYLHRPDLPGCQHAVTHVTPDTMLADALRGRFVIEFPTIYALQASPEQLPDTFRFATDSAQEDGSSDVSHIKREEGAIRASTAQSEVISVS